MRQHRESRRLPYSCEQLFALVLDIERYPEFVPGYRHSRVTRRQPGMLEVTQTVGFGPASIAFRSRADYTEPLHVHIHATDGPFRRLEVEWQFVAEDGGCRVTALTHYQAGGLLASWVDGWLDLVAPRLLGAFAKRAAYLYGAAGEPLH